MSSAALLREVHDEAGVLASKEACLRAPLEREILASRTPSMLMAAIIATWLQQAGGATPGLQILLGGP